MMVEIYTARGKKASFDAIPGGRKRYLVVPGGSEILETRVNDRTSRLLFVPCPDPLSFAGWTAGMAFRAARRGPSPFRLI